MRILFLTSQFPYPPHSGGALRAHGLIQGVAGAGYDVELFSFADDLPHTPLHDVVERIITAPPPQRTLRHRLFDLLLTRRADMARRFWSDEALKTICRRLALGDIDLLHAESIEMAAYFPAIQARFPQLPLIYGSLNAEADLQRSIFQAEKNNLLKRPRAWIGAVYSWLQWRRLTRLEARICELAAHVLAVSEPDQALLAGLSDTPVTVVKNALDVADYLHLAPDDQLGQAALVFTGTLDYRPNVDAVLWFAEEILPQVRAAVPQAHFFAVGQRPHARIQALLDNPHITVTGRVQSMEPYWTGAKVYVAPLRMGSGTRFKILSAMAAGCCVVSTTIGAQGLGVTSGQELVLADTPADFAQAVVDLLGNPDQRAALAARGRAYVQAHFDWSVIVPHLLAVYEQVLGRN